MEDKRHKPAVPLHAAVKYILRERDHYKEKLEKLIPYTKSLEEGRSEKIRELELQCLSLRNKLDKKNRAYEELLAECAILKRGYKESGWYRDLKAHNEHLKGQVDTLRKALNSALCENIQLKKNGRGNDQPA